jgi:hypothetical protein
MSWVPQIVVFVNAIPFLNLVLINCTEGFHCDISTHVMYFDQIHPHQIHLIGLSSIPLPFKTIFNGIHYLIFMHASKFHQPHSSTSLFALTPSTGFPPTPDTLHFIFMSFRRHALFVFLNLVYFI